MDQARDNPPPDSSPRRAVCLLRVAPIALMALANAALAQSQSFQPTYEDGVARRGQDYRSFQPMAPSALYCQQACVTDLQCRAWSYQPPEATSGKQPMCWLKGGVPPPEKAPGVVSGVVRPDSTDVAAAPQRETTNAPAPGGSVRAIFENYNLLGTFAVDCSKPASNENFHYVNAATDPDHVQRERLNGAGARDFLNIIDKASGLGPNEVSVGGTRAEGRAKGQAIQEVWRVESNRFMIVEAAIGETRVISGGRFNNGQAAWWINRCAAAGTPAQQPVASSVAPPPAPDGGVKALFEKYNLFGVYAQDCSKPAKAIDNWYYVNRLIDANHVQRDLMGGPSTVTSATILDDARELRPNEIAVAGTRDGKRTTGVWRLDKNRMVPLSATFGDQQLVSDGKWVKTGMVMPWITRCD